MMRLRKDFIASLLCLGTASLVFSTLSDALADRTGPAEASGRLAGVPLYEAEHIDTPPKIDGRLDDAVWREIRRAPIERRANNAMPNPRNRVGYWMAACDNGTLYLAFEVEDDTFFGHALDGVLEYNNDSIELFFDPGANYRSNLQYRLWPLGRAGKGAEVTLRPTWGKWNLAGRRTDRGYVVEAAIPFAHFREAALQDIGVGDIVGFDVAVIDQRVPTGGKAARLVTSWSGDGTNWQYAEQNGLLALGRSDLRRIAALRPDFRNIQESSAFEDAAVWPDLQLVEGRFQLEVPHQSSSATRYIPWRLGSVGHPLLRDPHPGDTLLSGAEVAPHSGGEHINVDPRPVEISLLGQRDGRALELRVVRTPFHPAVLYRSNADWISFFDGAGTGGPASVALALASAPGMTVRPIPPGEGVKVLYDAAVDGLLSGGSMLVTFTRPGDGRDFDLPMALFASRAPARIECNAQGGLTFRFERPRATGIGLLPLYGLEPVKASLTADWMERKTLSDDVVARLVRWEARSVQIPVECRRIWQYVAEDARFHVSYFFNYTVNLSEWTMPDKAGSGNEELLALLPPFFWRPDAPDFYRSPEIRDLDYAGWYGPLMGAPGASRLTLSLPAVSLADAPPRLDRQLLERSERAKKFLAEMDALDVPALIRLQVDRSARRRGEFMPHAFPLGLQEDAHAALALQPEASLQKLRGEFWRVLRSETFNPEKRDRYFPAAAPYLGSPIRYARLTYPYGVAEPYYGVIHTLAQTWLLGEGLGDPRVLLENWSEVKRIADVIWRGGFVEYRYDGGTLIGQCLLGLLDLAERTGDEDYARRVGFRLAEHASTARSFFAGRDWLTRIGAWDALGNSVLTLGEIQMRTRNGLASMTDRSAALDHTYMWDRSLGNPAILIPFALDVVTELEKRADELDPHWYLEDKPHWKRVDGIVRRFETRALVLYEPLSHLETCLDGLRKHLGQDTAYAACLATYLKRLQRDLASERE